MHLGQHATVRHAILLLLVCAAGYLVVREGIARIAPTRPALLAIAAKLHPDDARVNVELGGAALARAGLNEQLRAKNPILLRQAGARAMDALKTDPSRADAMAIVGLAAESAGNQQLARAAMRSSVALSRRVQAAQLWLVMDAAKRQDTDMMLKHVDTSLRTSARAQQLMFPLLAATLKDERSIPPFARLLQRDPDWASTFMYTAANQPEVSRNLAQLYLQSGKRYSHGGEDVADLIIKTLLARQDYTAAFDFYRSLSGRRWGEQVHDPNFKSADGLEPFNWSLEASSALDVLRSESPSGSGALEIRTSTGVSSGIAASQLLRLPAGLYRFANSAKAEAEEAQVDLQWRLRCASSGAILGEMRPLTERAALWRVPAACEVQVLELRVDASSTLEPETIFVDPVKLTRQGS